MKSSLRNLLIAASGLLAALPPAYGQRPPDADYLVDWQQGILIPQTSLPRAEDAGLWAHTNHLLALTPGEIRMNGGLGPGGGMTPAQLRAVYAMPSTGGSGVIALGGAYHYPNALKDFNTFSRQFGLPIETSVNVTAATNKVFQIVYASGAKPASNVGWAQEAALDIEWAHAMAPGAKIILVEARSNSYKDLFLAVDKATALPGVKQVSMSWGSNEFSGETAYDSRFPQNKGVVYFASSGDVGGVVSYPSVSPNVVAVGGTRVATDSAGNFLLETGWSGSGGGVSLYEPRPAYQLGIPNAPTSQRGVPDISADADPHTGVCVYDSYGSPGWMVFGGTSASAPCVAGMTNLAGSKYSSSAQQLAAIYAAIGTANYRDTVSGAAGSFSCLLGWDFVTGVGSPQGIGSL